MIQTNSSALKIEKVDPWASESFEDEMRENLIQNFKENLRLMTNFTFFTTLTNTNRILKQ